MLYFDTAVTIVKCTIHRSGCWLFSHSEASFIICVLYFCYLPLLIGYIRLSGDGLLDYVANGLGLAVQYSPLVWCILKLTMFYCCSAYTPRTVNTVLFQRASLQGIGFKLEHIFIYSWKPYFVMLCSLLCKCVNFSSRSYGYYSQSRIWFQKLAQVPFTCVMLTCVYALADSVRRI